MNLFLASTSLLPSYGGPAFSVSGLATALAEAGVHVGLWAADQSAAFTPLLTPGSRVQRLTGSEAEALDRFGKTNVMHDNGIWQPHNHRLAGLALNRGIPRVVSTRGMVEGWALTHKRLKKRLAWWFYQRRDLKEACCHHATAEAEAQALEDLELGVPVTIVPNGVDLGRERPQKTRAQGENAIRNGPRTALFLGRIYPIKGLPMLIDAWARVRPRNWHLRIAGPDEAGHQKQIEKAIRASELATVVSFSGPLAGRTKEAAFLDAELLVLPTHSENFGMVIAEALAYGLPVLTTTAAPWAVLRDRGCGWWVDPTVDGIAEGLRQATSLAPATLREMGSKGRAVIAADYGWKRIADRFLTLYDGMLAKA